jgi:XTP/dITP diphosphohydrolase
LLKLLFLSQSVLSLNIAIPMTDLVFATHNPDKVREVSLLLPADIRLRTLEDIGCAEDIPETGLTLEENAMIKANYVWQKYGLPCFADDTGLLVDALNGAPGVYSARFAGEQKSAEANIRKLLNCLEGNMLRRARFETVIALVGLGKHQIFKGEVIGDIALEPSGTRGFGYDPIFRPEGEQATFAELLLAEKNRISHRARALAHLIRYLETYSMGI